MKTREVIKEVKRLGFTVKNDFELRIVIYNQEMITVAIVYSDRLFNINTAFDAFDMVEKDKKEKLIHLIVEYARTPVEERKEEKKYYLKHKWLSDSGRRYLNLYIDKNEYEINTDSNLAEFKTQFTQAEIDEIKRKFNTSLEDFEIVEVEDGR